MPTTLRCADFETVEVKANLGIAEFRQALRRFQAQADGAEVALIYFAGHGIEAKGANWLIPTDAELNLTGTSNTRPSGSTLPSRPSPAHGCAFSFWMSAATIRSATGGKARTHLYFIRGTRSHAGVPQNERASEYPPCLVQFLWTRIAAAGGIPFHQRRPLLELRCDVFPITQRSRLTVRS